MNVTIYTKDNCSFCTNAKALMNAKGITYLEQKLGEDFTREYILDYFPAAKTFPIIIVDGMNIGGYTQLKEMLETTQTDSRKLLNESN